MSAETPPSATGPTAPTAEAAEKPAPVPGSLPFDLLAEPLRGQIEWVQRRHGLTPAAASLAVLTAVLAVCGPSRRIDHPFGARALPPALSVVLYGRPAAYVEAAVELSLDPIRQWMLRRIGPPGKEQLRRARLRLGELHQERIAKEFHINSAAPGPPAAGSTFDGALRGKELEALQKTLKDEHAKILHQIKDITFLLKPHLLANDAALPRLLEPGRLSTDGAVLHTSLGGHAVQAWTGANDATKTELARLLHLAWHGLPDAGDEDCHTRPLLSNVLVVDLAGAGSLWADRGLATAGVNQHLFFVEAGHGNTKFDLSAGCPNETAKPWTEGLQCLLNSRLEGSTVDHYLDNAATEIFMPFTRELLAETSASEPAKARRLERTPVLALKLALLVHAISPDRKETAIGAKTVDFACALATAVGVEDLRFMNRMSPKAADESADTTGQEAINKLFAKLRLRGPLPWRALLRSTPSQKAEPLQRQLEKAIAAGLIRKEGTLFHAVGPA